MEMTRHVFRISKILHRAFQNQGYMISKSVAIDQYYIYKSSTYGGRKFDGFGNPETMAWVSSGIDESKTCGLGMFDSRMF
jgi:hypothetical protein